MRAGKLDRKVIFKKFTATQNSQGQENETYVEFYKTMAEWMPMMGSDRLKGDGKHSYLSGRFRIRPYKTGIEHTMQVECEGQLYRITGLAEIPRRKGLEITVEAWQ